MWEYKGIICEKGQRVDCSGVNFLEFAQFGRNDEISEEMKKAKSAYKKEIMALGCKYNGNYWYFTTDSPIDRERVEEICNKYRNIIYNYYHSDEILQGKDIVMVDIGAISAEETKSRRVQILLKPSVYKKIKDGAEYFNLSINEYVNKIFENLTFEKKEKVWKPKKKRITESPL